MDYILFLLYIVPVFLAWFIIKPQIDLLLQGKLNYQPKNPKTAVFVTVVIFLIPVLNLILICNLIYGGYKSAQEEDKADKPEED